MCSHYITLHYMCMTQKDWTFLTIAGLFNYHHLPHYSLWVSPHFTRSCMTFTVWGLNFLSLIWLSQFDVILGFINGGNVFTPHIKCKMYGSKFQLGTKSWDRLLLFLSMHIDHEVFYCSSINEILLNEIL